jgi:hypothetical protein
MQSRTERRQALRALGLGLAAGAAGITAARSGQAAQAAAASLMAPGAKSLKELARKLHQAPRRRDFTTVPMILDRPEQWDHEALTEIIAYRGGPKQAWDNTDLGGPWLNLMRNSLNVQIWSFKHPDFLCVSATHGLAHLALYDDATWEKYDLAALTGGKFTAADFARRPEGGNAADYEAPDGLFSAADNGIAVLAQRGVAFLACHNAIWELAARLAGGKNPDHLGVEPLAAELTNHLTASVVLTPGAVATLVELQHAGFTFGK